MEFRILGPVEVRGVGGPARLGGTKQVALLSGLILQANHVVPVERLVEATWGEDPPAGSNAALHTRLFRLRRALADVEIKGADRIVTHPTGYLLRIEPGELDLEAFREHVKQARTAAAASEWSDAARAYQAALDLWRGPALDGVPGRFARTQASGLEETQTSVIEEHAEVRLTLGDHATLVAELNELVATQPLRERLRGQLMLALYRSGRQADALAAYQEIYRLLVDELGIQPGSPLQRLHQQILAGDVALRAPSVVPQAPAISVSGLVPRQLPTDVANFTGREAYLDELDALLAGKPGQRAVVITAISGTAGVGKTALALRWAHRVAERLPDGQLYVNLRGYAPAPPMVVTEALAQFLRALGVPQEQIPVDQDEQAAMYRSLMADKRTLVVLDNAATADQVRPLLPGSPTCLVLVTSRDDLRGLTANPGAHRLVLDVLGADETRTLLTRTIGLERVEAEEEAAAELARLCGFLPLALRIAAAHIASQPHQTIATYLAKLAEGSRLAQLAIDEDREVAVRASFDLSYQTLGPDASRLFRLLGLVPGPDFTPPAAAALADITVEETVRLLERLATAHLIERHLPGRFQFHDLLRLYAAERCETEDSAQDREQAMQRLFDMYLRTTSAASSRLYPGIEHLLGVPAGSDVRPLALTDHTQALVWLDSERPNLVAAIRYAENNGPEELTWHLADSLCGYFYGRMYRADWLEIAEIGLRAARLAGNQIGEAAMLHTLAHCHFSFGQYEQAVDLDLQAEELYRPAENFAGQAEIHKRLGCSYWPLAKLDEALEHFKRSSQLYQEVGNRAGEAAAINGMCLVFVERGRFDEMLEYNTRALHIQQETGSRMGEATSLHLNGYACGELGRFDEATDYVTRALAIYRETGFRYNEASALKCLAAVHRDSGRYSKALEFGHRSLTTARDLNDRRSESHALDCLASVYLCLNKLEDAVDYGNQALRLARETGFRRAEVDALIAMVAVQRAFGHHDEALTHALDALREARDGTFRQCEGLALTALADVHLDLGEHEKAVDDATQALVVHREVGHRIGEARTLRTLGHAERQLHGQRAADPHWPDALAIFTELGTPEADQLRTLIGTA